MLGKRLLTAIIGIPVAVYIINYGQGLFVVAVTLLNLLAWHEYCGMLRKKDIKVSYRLGILGNIILLGCAWWGNSQETIMVMLVITLLVLVKTVISCQAFSLSDAAFTLLGMMYIGLCFSHLILLRFTNDFVYFVTSFATLSAGAVYLWLPFIGTWASDSFAFLVGSQLGKHKLCPTVSPGKTVEGVIGGLVGSILAVIAFGNFFHIPLLHTVMIGILVGIVAPLGDLAESALKRFTGVKDSGRILPGHGGVLDRFDSILFAVPTVYYYVQTFMVP
ncbi:MAG TPA: phosphatidate cytidylyltransferase [Negativicutes bacterium]|jgi:phosphatidate cytidylyltransferase